ncbi:MAG: hypothetical protein WC760_08395 [Bacteroidia bacterium]|jgi:hypothetical protein
MRILRLLLLLLIALGTQSCSSDCSGPKSGYFYVYQFTNPGTFIQLNWKNRIPRYVHYPAFNKTDSIFLVSVKERYSKNPVSWVHGFYLNSKENFTTVVFRYDVGEDTVTLHYSCNILYTENECEEYFQIMANEVSLGYSSGDSIYLFNKQLFLP